MSGFPVANNKLIELGEIRNQKTIDNKEEWTKKENKGVKMRKKKKKQKWAKNKLFMEKQTFRPTDAVTVASSLLKMWKYDYKNERNASKEIQDKKEKKAPQK